MVIKPDAAYFSAVAYGLTREVSGIWLSGQWSGTEASLKALNLSEPNITYTVACF